MIRTSEKFIQYTGDKGTRYYKYVPTAGNPIGVVQFMHGKGEIGYDLAMVERTHLPKMLDVDGVRAGTEMQFTVIAAQEEPGQEWWGKSITATKIAQSMNLGKPNYTGLSLGALCFDNIINDMGDVFSTVALVAGGFEDSLSTKTFEALKKIPSIFYYGTNDNVIAYGYSSTKKMYDKLKAAGADTTLIEYQGRGHDIWPDSYNHYIGWLNSKVGTVVTPPPVKEAIAEQYILDGKLVTIGVNGTKIN